MNELYELCNKYHELLLTNKDKISFIKKIDLLNDIDDYHEKMNDYYQKLISKKCDLREIIDYSKIGNFLNYDLLIDFLINVYHPNYINGPYEKEVLEKEIVFNYYNNLFKNTYCQIDKIFKIKVMINKLVLFIKRYYDINSFNNYEINNKLNEIKALSFSRLNNKMCFKYNFKLSDDVIYHLEENRKIEDDLLSLLIDNYDFNQILVGNLNTIKNELIRIKKLILTKNSSCDLILINIYFDFINELISYFESRIQKLNYHCVEKVIIKDFFTS